MQRILGMATPRRSWYWLARAAAVAVFALAPWHADAEAGQQRWKWWQAPQVQRDLALSAEQIAGIDQVFRETWPVLHGAKTELDTLERELSALIAAADAEEAEVAGHIERVESARSTLGRTRSMMLYRMYRILTPDQRVTLKSLHRQWERERQAPSHGR